MRTGKACRSSAAALMAVAALFATGLAAQTRPDPPPASAIGETVTVVPAPAYEASGLHRTLLGEGWRDVWLTPVEATVFGFDRYEGGVRWLRQGGGNQSITLHLEAEDGWREYRFRSVDKFPQRGLPRELRGTVVGGAVADLISAYFPAAPLMVPPFVDALGLLHVEPELRIMPDDPRLGELRDTFAGMLGTVELVPNEAPDDGPGFASSRSIKGSEEFLNDIEDSKAHVLDEAAFLRARLLDFLINDTDRTYDNMRWARFGDRGDYRWRPIPIDRDWAFVDAGGWITEIVQGFYPKLVGFGPDYPDIQSLTFSSHRLDRRLLQRLTRSDFEQGARDVAAAISDPVIEAALDRMPERWRRETDAADRIRAAIRGRRATIGDVALEFYDYLAEDVDLHATDEPDRATIERFEDGRVRVRITWPEGHPRAGDLFYDRTFLPSETGEVRLDLHGGDDHARVIGAPSAEITIRIVGGGGDDDLVDEAGGGATHLYDQSGDNRLGGEAAHISTKEWDPPVPNEGIRVGGGWAPDWGDETRWLPAVDYADFGGLVLGGGPTWVEYGFRRLPYHWRLDARLLIATGVPSVGGSLSADYRLENSPLALTLRARGIPYGSLRFNGFGNDSPDAGDPGLVEQDVVSVMPALTWHIGFRDRDAPGSILLAGDEGDDVRPIRPVLGTLDVGPVLLWSEPSPQPGAPLAAVDPLGNESLARVGMRAALRLDQTDRTAARRGWRLEAAAAGYPATGALPSAFAEVRGTASAYLPLGWPFLAFRVGGSAVTDDAPVQHSAWIGGRTSLRGYRWQRFRGDRAAYGSAELRVPVAPIELLLRWDLGIFGLVDAGRVWYDGQSPGGWHTGVGGGIWLSALGQAVSVFYANGEQNRIYLQLGLSY